jgi:acyl carrier protein
MAAEVIIGEPARAAGDGLERRIGLILEECLGLDAGEAAPGARLADDLGADSLDLIDAAHRVEAAFGVDLLDGSGPQAAKGSTVAELAALVRQKRAALGWPPA